MRSATVRNFPSEIDNVEGKPGDYALDLDIAGPLSAAPEALHRTFKLDAGARKSLTIPVTATAVGRASVDLKLSGPGLAVPQTLALDVSPGTSEPLSPLRAHAGAGGEPYPLAAILLADFVPGTGACFARRVLACRHRCSGPPAGARSLSLWLFGTDRQPRLCRFFT